MANLVDVGTTESNGSAKYDMPTVFNTTGQRNAYNATLETAPDGTLTADKFEENTTDTTNTAYDAWYGQVQTSASTTYYVSLFMKADENTFAALYDSGRNEAQIFDLANGTVESAYNGYSGTAGIVPYGNGWYRCWFTMEETDPGGVFNVGTATATSGTTLLHTLVVGNGHLVWGLHVDTANYTDWTTLPYLVGAEEYFHSTGFNTHTFTEPAGAQEDDFFLVQMNARDVSGVHTITEPGDFTVLDEFYETTGSADDLQYIAYKVRGATAGSGYAFSLNTNDSCGYTMSVWRNVDTSNPFDVSYVKGTHYSAVTDAVNTAAPAITTVTDNAVAVLLYANTQVHSANQDGSPSGYTEAVRTANMAVDSKGVSVNYKYIPTAGTETPGSFTFATGTTTTDRRAFTLALKPAPTGTAVPLLMNYYNTE